MHATINLGDAVGMGVQGDAFGAPPPAAALATELARRPTVRQLYQLQIGSEEIHHSASFQLQR